MHTTYIIGPGSWEMSTLLLQEIHRISFDGTHCARKHFTLCIVTHCKNTRPLQLHDNNNLIHMMTLRVYKVHIQRHVCSQSDRYDGKHDVFMVEPGCLQAVGGSRGRLILLLSKLGWTDHIYKLWFYNSGQIIYSYCRLMDREISLISVYLKIELNFTVHL